MKNEEKIQLENSIFKALEMDWRSEISVGSNTAFLFIGLGGMGADALFKLKRKVRNKVKRPCDSPGKTISEYPPNIGFMEIDTDPSGISDTDRKEYFKQCEFCDISVHHTGEAVRQVLKEKEKGDECWQWWESTEEANYDYLIKGTGGIPQIGKMLLALNIKKVVSAVSSKIDNLHCNNPTVDRVEIMIFSGVSGGTGAGILLDMAYLLKKIALCKIPECTVHGYLFLPDVAEEKINPSQACVREKLEATGFACLKELDYWMNVTEHRKQYHLNFQSFSYPVTGQPFEHCHLLGTPNSDNSGIAYNDILESVADNVLFYIRETDAFADNDILWQGVYTGLKYQCLVLRCNKKHSECNEYLTLKTAKSEIPWMEIDTMLIARTFENLEKSIFQNYFTEERFNQILETELELTYDQIRMNLYENVPAYPTLEKGFYKYLDIWSQNAPYILIERWIDSFGRTLSLNATDLLGRLEYKWIEFFKSTIANRNTGPLYLMRFMYSENKNCCLINYIRNLYSFYQEKISIFKEQSIGLEEEMKQAFSDGMNSGIFHKSKNIKRYLKALNVWYKNEELLLLNNQIIQILKIFLDRLEMYYSEILEPLEDKLITVRDIVYKHSMYSQKDILECKYKKSIIYPDKFEQIFKSEINSLIDSAKINFLTKISYNLSQWVGRDVTKVDEYNGENVDIAGFLQTFVYENFAKVHLNIDDVIGQLAFKSGEDFKELIIKILNDLLRESSSPLYAERFRPDDVVDGFTIVIVPRKCEYLYRVIKDYIACRGLNRRVLVRKGYGISWIQVIALNYGYTLASNEYMEQWKIAYEKLIKNPDTVRLVHSTPEWR